MINDRYRIIKKIGEGRSTVFLCSDTEFQQKEIAIKILPPNVDKTEIKVFKDEYLTLQKLTHSNIIKSYEFGTVVISDDEIYAGSKFFTLEYYNGESLLKYKLNSSDELKQIIKQLCSVLFYLHQSNFIYYDLKLENILFSLNHEKIEIKLIDLGFARQTKLNQDKETRGTAEYIAPELLQNASHDYKVDLYSLGILLYKIIYRKFPFNTDNEIEIYKAHIEKEFEFPETEIEPDIVNVVKKLLQKEPAKRYNTSLEILKDININIEEELTREWLPASNFTNRKDAQNILKKYISDEQSIEVFSIKGVEGAGKTSLAEQIYSTFDNAVLIKNDRSKSGIDFIRYMVKSIAFSEAIYSGLPEDILQKIDGIINNSSAKLNEDLKIIFTRISLAGNFILILDDFNSYDDFVLEILKEIIPIFQVNKQKLILTENSNFTYASSFLFNMQEVNLSPFTDTQVEEFLDISYFDQFPKNEIKNLILRYADLLPGSIKSFINDIILIKIINYEYEGIRIKESDETINLLKSSHEEIYKVRFDTLSNEEKEYVKLLSAFEIAVEKKIAAGLLNSSEEEISELVLDLQKKNIFQQTHSISEPQFTSEGIKKYIYSAIPEKREYHYKIAEKLREKFYNINSIELARHFECAEKYSETYLILKEEVKEAEKQSAFTYQKKILKRLIKMPLNEKGINDIKFELCKTYNKLSEFQSSLNIINELLKEKFSEEETIELSILEGRGLIGTGEIEKGISLLKSLLPKVINISIKQKLMLEIAGAEFDLNNYSEAEKICEEIIRDNIQPENVGKAFNLLGIINFERDGNFNVALEKLNQGLKIYENNNMIVDIAGTELNIGIIHTLKNDFQNVEKHWNNSLKVNASIGNLEQEASLLLNYGIYYYQRLILDKAQEFYERSSIIFSSLGNKNKYGIVNINLTEIYIILCKYRESFETLDLTRNIFMNTINIYQELEVLFLYGRLLFIFNDLENLNNLIEDFENKLKNTKVAENSKTNLSLLKQLYLFNSKPKHQDVNEIIEIRDKYLSQRSNFYYVYTTRIIIELMLKQNKTDDVISELNSKILLDVCKNSSIYDAERNYLLGLVSINLDSGLKSPIEYFEKSFQHLKEYHITELTWKVLYNLSKIYNNRGKKVQAKENSLYCKLVIEHIVDNINDKRLKKLYLQKKEIKEALNLVQQLETT